MILVRTMGDLMKSQNCDVERFILFSHIRSFRARQKECHRSRRMNSGFHSNPFDRLLFVALTTFRTIGVCGFLLFVITKCSRISPMCCKTIHCYWWWVSRSKLITRLIKGMSELECDWRTDRRVGRWILLQKSEFWRSRETIVAGVPTTRSWNILGLWCIGREGTQSESSFHDS